MAFVLHFPIVIPCLIERVVTYFNVYNLSYSLKEHKAVFWKRKHFIFSIVAGSI